MTLYAQGTSVPVDRTKAEIEAILERYGAGQFGYMKGEDQAAIIFEMQGRRVMFRLKMPSRAAFLSTPKGQPRADGDVERHYAAAVRQKWRALLLCIKGKLEAVESEIETFEVAFMPHIVLPNGKTVGDAMVPQIEQAYNEKKMPPLLGYQETSK